MLGAGLMSLSQAPGGMLVGALAATTAAALAGRPLNAPGWAYTALLVATGAAAGSSVTADAFAAAARWPLSMGLLAVCSAVMTFAAYQVFRRVGGCDDATAFYAAAPGAFSTVVALAESRGADMRRVGLAQMLRLAALALTAPLALAGHPAARLGAEAPALLHGPPALIALAGSSAAGWALAAWLKWPSPPFLGPMAGAAAIHLCGVVSAPPPPLVTAAATVGLGAFLGARFSGVSPGALLRFLPTCALALLVMAAIALFAGLGAGRLTGVGAASGLLAFAPGSMDVMIALAVAVGANTAYVAAHQTARFLGLLAVLPLLSRRRAAA